MTVLERIKYEVFEPDDKFKGNYLIMKQNLERNEKLLKRLNRIKSIRIKFPQWFYQILNKHIRETIISIEKIKCVMKRIDKERGILDEENI